MNRKNTVEEVQKLDAIRQKNKETTRQTIKETKVEVEKMAQNAIVGAKRATAAQQERLLNMYAGMAVAELSLPALLPDSPRLVLAPDQIPDDPEDAAASREQERKGIAKVHRTRALAEQVIDPSLPVYTMYRGKPDYLALAFSRGAAAEACRSVIQTEMNIIDTLVQDEEFDRDALQKIRL